MKKTILALAILGALAPTAQAQTNVSIGGVLQVNVKNYSIGSTARNTAHEIRVDDDYTSRFWLSGSEDLGGGNSAIFYVENRLNVPDNAASGAFITGNGLGNGDTWVGLKGAWGQVQFGKFIWLGGQGINTELTNSAGGAGHASMAAMPTSMLGTFTIMDEFGNGHAGYLDAGARRLNAVQYVSPFMSGFLVKLGMSSNSAGNEGTVPAATGGANNYSDGREFFLQGLYMKGPLFMALGYRNNTAEGRLAPGIDDKQIRFSGSYILPINLKIGLQVDRATRSTASGAGFWGVGTGASQSRTAWEVPISYTFGKSAILASFTRAGDNGSAANSGAKMYTLGWDYALSKRTNLGIYYSKLKNDANGAYQPFLAGISTLTGSGLLAGESASTLAFGLKHVF